MTTKNRVKLSFDEAVFLAQKVVRGNENFVYSSPVDADGNKEDCSYFDPVYETPSCLVGHILALKGVTRDDVGTANSGIGIRSLCDGGVIDADDDGAITFLELVQENQDSRERWEDAVTNALDAMRTWQ